MNNFKKGFTIVEILVVVAIIGILASIVMVSLNSSRAKARDANRAKSIENIKGALELYFANNGQYPSVGTDDAGYLISTLGPTLVPNFLPALPQDPYYPNISSVAGDFQYVRGSAGSYGLWVYLETAAGSVPAGSRCVTGVNINPGWWGAPPVCPF